MQIKGSKFGEQKIKKKLTSQLKNGEIPIYLRVTVSGTRDEISTYQSVEAKKWNSKKGIAKGIGKKGNELNYYLYAVRANLLKIHRQLEIGSEVITAKLIIVIYIGKVNPQKSLIEVFKEHNKKCRELIDKNEIVEKTVQRYERTVRYLQEYMKEALSIQDILLNKITPSFPIPILNTS